MEVYRSKVYTDRPAFYKGAPPRHGNDNDRPKLQLRSGQ